MSFFRRVLSLVLVAAVLAGGFPSAPVNALTNSQGATLFGGSAASGCTVPVQGWGTVNRLRGVYPFSPTGTYTNNISSWETWLGGTTDFVLAYATGTTWANLLSNVDAQIASIAPSNKPIHWSIGFPTNPGVSSLAQVASGAEDANFTAIANKIKAARPGDSFWVVRPLWEAQNAAIGPWNGVGQEKLYIKAFQRVVNIFLGNSLLFRIDWTMNETTTINGTPYDPSRLYPGDSCVDLIGQDFYWIQAFSGTDPNAAWRGKQTATYGLNWLSNFARARNKPLAMGEWGINSDGPQYISLALEWFAMNNVALQAYFNANNGGNFNNQIDTNQYPAVATRFKYEFAAATPAGLTSVNLIGPGNGNSFTTAPWSGVANGIASITAGQQDPFGGTTASNVLETTASSTHLLQETPALTISTTQGIFRMLSYGVPINGRNWFQHNLGQQDVSPFDNGIVAYYDLSVAGVGNNVFAYPAVTGPAITAAVAIPENNNFTGVATEFISAPLNNIQVIAQLASADGTNSYTGTAGSGITLNNVILRRVGDITYQAESNAIFAAFTTPPTASRKQLIDNAVSCLKTNNIWTTLTGLQVHAAADSQAATVDWANLSRAATLTGSPTFTADRGFTTNGSSSYVNSLIDPTTSVGSNGTTAGMTGTSFFAGFWSLTSAQFASGSPFGMLNGTSGITIQPRNTSDQQIWRSNTFTTAPVFTSTDGSGFWVVDRGTSASSALYHQGVNGGGGWGGTNATQQSLPLRTGIVNTTFSGVQTAATVAGSHLTAPLQLAFYNCMRPYMTGVGVP